MFKTHQQIVADELQKLPFVFLQMPEAKAMIKALDKPNWRKAVREQLAKLPDLIKTLQTIDYIDCIVNPRPLPSYRVLDLSRERYGRLTVICFYDVSGRGKARWLCLCTCGNLTVAKSQSLRQDDAKSCGCLLAEMTEPRLEIGQRLGNRTILGQATPLRENASHHYYTAQCDCGKIGVYQSSHLKQTQSCGCATKDKARLSKIEKAKKRFEYLIDTEAQLLTINKFVVEETGPLKVQCTCVCGTIILVRPSSIVKGKGCCGCSVGKRMVATRGDHHLTGTPAYVRWIDLNRRRSNKQMDPEWKDPRNFCAWFLKLGAQGRIRRIDQHKPYGPDNCWIDPDEGIDYPPFYEYEGKLVSLSYAVKFLAAPGLNYHTVWSRLHRQKMPFKQAITKPLIRALHSDQAASQ